MGAGAGPPQAAGCRTAALGRDPQAPLLPRAAGKPACSMLMNTLSMTAKKNTKMPWGGSVAQTAAETEGRGERSHSEARTKI